jgi:hypothetical protein
MNIKKRLSNKDYISLQKRDSFSISSNMMIVSKVNQSEIVILILTCEIQIIYCAKVLVQIVCSIFCHLDVILENE